jgi:hypothetical protein
VSEQLVDLKARMESTQNLLITLSKSVADSLQDRAYTTLAERYAYGYDSLLVEQNIHPDGSIDIKRTITVQPRINALEKLPQSLNIDLDTFSEKEHPIVLPDKVLMLDKQSGGHSISRSNSYVKIAGGWVVEIRFTPPIPAEKTVKFAMSEKLGKVYVFHESRSWYEEHDSPDDYFAWRIDRPTRQFRASVTFPKHFKPENFEPRVLYQPLPVHLSEAQRHQDEERRLKEHLVCVPLDDDRFCLKLGQDETGVDLPLLGLIYMVRWDPFWSD